jgi:cell division transport system permease protein
MFLLRYFIVRAFQNMRGNLLPHLVTICIIAISMVIFSAFSLITFNLTSFLRIWEEKIQIIAYLKKATPSNEVEVLSKSIRGVSGIESVKYVSSSEAMAFMETKLGSQKNLLEGVQPDVLPPSFEIQLEAGYRNSPGIKDVAAQLKQFPQIEEVQYGQEWVDAFSVVVHIIRLTQWILGGLLTAAMTFIIANTLQLAISSRREEIEIMHLVGARSSFIQVPFYMEGLIQGVLGAALAMVFLFLLYKIFLMYVSPLVKAWLLSIPVSFLPPETIVWYLSGGMVLGFFGSFVASIKILKYSG